jgi:cytochrome P450
MFLNYGSANVDPCAWADPGKFDIDRAGPIGRKTRPRLSVENLPLVFRSRGE